MARVTHGIAILLGRPQLASEDDERDEDHLDHEEEQGHDPHGDFILAILHALNGGDESAVDGVAALARGLAHMADAARRGDDERVRQAAEDACNALDQVLGTGGSGEDEEHDAPER